MLMVMATFGVKAEQYDEVNLLGKWEITERAGQYLILEYFEDCEFEGNQVKYISFGQCIVDERFPSNGIFLDNSNYEDADWSIYDFFISNGNKIHIMLVEGQYPSLHFVIDSFTDSELKLHTYDNKMHMTLKRVANPNKVGEIHEVVSSQNGIYNLNGTKVENPDKGIYVVKTGSETSKKMIR